MTRKMKPGERVLGPEKAPEDPTALLIKAVTDSQAAVAMALSEIKGAEVKTDVKVDMKPVAAAISKQKDVNVAAVDLKPLAAALDKQSAQLAALVKKLDNKPAKAWNFEIDRDTSGFIRSIEATRSQGKG
jgi:hypothetical protein